MQKRLQCIEKRPSPAVVCKLSLGVFGNALLDDGWIKCRGADAACLVTSVWCEGVVHFEGSEVWCCVGVLDEVVDVCVGEAAVGIDDAKGGG